MPSGSSQLGSGLLVIDKPRGVTSHDVVAAVRSILHIKRVGHAGTLDPMATGVLIVGFGHATRLLNVIVGHDKTYEATIRLGVATTTDDAEGEPIAADPLPDCASIDQATIEQVIREHFIGVIDQVPSTYSAIKINGKRAYDLARQGVDVELKARSITVSAFDILAMRRVPSAAAVQPETAATGTTTVPHGNLIDLDVRVTCSAGTYIRALGRDLRRQLGVGGHLTALRRTRIGNCDVTAPNVIAARAVTRSYTDREGHEVTRNKAVFDCDADGLRSHAMPMLESAKAAMPSIAINEEQARDLRFGRRIEVHTRIDSPTAAYVQVSGEVIAILEPAGDADAGTAKPVAVFPAD